MNYTVSKSTAQTLEAIQAIDKMEALIEKAVNTYTGNEYTFSKKCVAPIKELRSLMDNILLSQVYENLQAEEVEKMEI